MSGKTKIKLCGMFRDCDIEYVNEAQPDYIGFIVDFPKSHRSVSPERAKELKALLDPAVADAAWVGGGPDVHPGPRPAGAVPGEHVAVLLKGEVRQLVKV